MILVESVATRVQTSRLDSERRERRNACDSRHCRGADQRARRRDYDHVGIAGTCRDWNTLLSSIETAKEGRIAPASRPPKLGRKATLLGSS